MSKSRYKERKKKQEQNKRRLDAIKDLMSTFAMTTVAVVAVVTLIPSSPKAEIIKAVPLSDEIVYQVTITDEDNALDVDTLVVVLENQLEYYEQSIELGEQSGYFEGLLNNTEYRLSVYGSKGFGQERLDTLLLSTQEKEGGTILSVTPQTIDFSTSYLVDLSVVDPEMKYSSIDLFYGYAWEADVPLQYSSINVTEPRTILELWDISTTYPFHIYIQGTTIDGTEILDEIWVTPPYELHASVYMDYINQDEIGFYVYGDMHVEDLSYRMNVYSNGLLISSQEFSESNEHMESSNFTIDGLSPNTLYEFECIAIYKNPQTLRLEEVTIYQEELATLDSYSFTYTKELIGESFEFTITLTDPNDYFDLAYYESYDLSSDFPTYLDGQTNAFVIDGNEKTVILTVLTPTVSTYEISIGIRSNLDFTINQIIEIIIED